MIYDYDEPYGHWPT